LCGNQTTRKTVCRRGTLSLVYGRSMRGGRSTTLQVRGLKIESLFFPLPSPWRGATPLDGVIYTYICLEIVPYTNATVHRAVSMAVVSYYKNAYIIFHLIFLSVCLIFWFWFVFVWYLAVA